MEKLVSYGTLKLEPVQLSTFGRKLHWYNDILTGYRLSTLEIKDPNVIATSGQSSHPILKYTGNPLDIVDVIVFDITFQELIQADAYEVSDYKRVSVKVNSGIYAWAYVSAV